MASIRRKSVTNLGTKIRQAHIWSDVSSWNLCFSINIPRTIDRIGKLIKRTNDFKITTVSIDHNFSDYTTVKTVEGKYNLVAILCAYKHPVVGPGGIGAHAIAYVKMNDYWYEGDNEKGVLRLRINGPPTWRHTYPGSEMDYMTYFYVNILVPIFPIPPLNPHGFHGKIISKQNGITCLTDSVQTILLNANGYREQFTHLYNLVKPSPGVIITIDQFIKSSMKILKSLFNVDPEITETTQTINSTLLVLSLTYARKFLWENQYPLNYVTHEPGNPENVILQINKSEGVWTNNRYMDVREHMGGKHLKKHRKTYKRKN